jgi:hypothetical protein
MLPLKRLLEIGGWAAAPTAVVDVGKLDFTGIDAESAASGCCGMVRQLGRRAHGRRSGPQFLRRKDVGADQIRSDKR